MNRDEEDTLLTNTVDKIKVNYLHLISYKPKEPGLCRGEYGGPTLVTTFTMST